MRYVWIFVAGLTALVLIFALERAGVDLSQRPFAELLGEDPDIEGTAEIDDAYLDGPDRGAYEPPAESPAGRQWDRRLGELMRWQSDGTLANHAGAAVEFFARLDSYEAETTVPENALLRDARMVLELRVGIIDALVAAGLRDDARNIATGDTGAVAGYDTDYPDAQSLIELLQRLAERRLGIGLNASAIKTANDVWKLQLALLGPDHPDIAAVWAERQAFAARARATSEERAAADVEIGPASPAMQQARARRADAALASGDIDDALRSYEAAKCANEARLCEDVPAYAAGIAMRDPARAGAFIAAYTGHAFDDERTELESVSIFVRALQAKDPPALLREAMRKGHGEPVEMPVL